MNAKKSLEIMLTVIFMTWEKSIPDILGGTNHIHNAAAGNQVRAVSALLARHSLALSLLGAVRLAFKTVGGDGRLVFTTEHSDFVVLDLARIVAGFRASVLQVL